MSDNVTVIGLPKVLKALAAKGVDIEQQMQKFVTQTTMDVQRIGKRKAPVDTGNLRAKIYAGVTREGLEGMVGSGEISAVIGRFKEVGHSDSTPDVEYAVYVHNGTRYMAGNPYLAKAAQEGEKLAASRAAKLVREVL